RVIFCTNIAETSLTIPRVGYVIDSGLRLQVSYTPMLHIKQYSLEMTTAVSAIQRKGRAGRLGPGICRRLYRKEDMKLFPEQIYSNPES
ncbi:P-loop containing nucleoside triphosphate hydrolase protein, partial [Zopfochytrium polystomum]